MTPMGDIDSALAEAYQTIDCMLGDLESVLPDTPPAELEAQDIAQIGGANV
jgi:hypothetical protein